MKSNSWCVRVVVVAGSLFVMGVACTATPSSGGSGGRDGGNATGGAAMSSGGAPASGGNTATGGITGGGTGGAPATGGVSGGSGGNMAGSGGSDGSGGMSSSGGSTPGTGGTAGAASGGRGAAGNGAAGKGGAPGSGGGATGGRGGTTGQGGATGFVCNQVTAMTLTREWFEAGFESNPGIVNARWQLKAREHGYITEWANPNSDFWNEPPESPCTTGSASPDHVVLTVLSWVPACCTTQAQWDTQITAAINTLKMKYTGLRRIDLMTVIRGPGNMACPTAPAAGETIVIPPELDAALAAAATKFPDLVFVAPKFEGASCAAFSGGGPHLTTQGNTAVAKMISAAFVGLQ